MLNQTCEVSASDIPDEDEGRLQHQTKTESFWN